MCRKRTSQEQEQEQEQEQTQTQTQPQILEEVGESAFNDSVTVRVPGSTVEVLWIRFTDRVVDVLSEQQRQVPTTHQVQKTVEIPQVPFTRRVLDVPAIQSMLETV